MRIKLYDEYGAGNSGSVFDAFRDGALAAGDDIVLDYDNSECIVIWSILFAGRMAGNRDVFRKAKADKKIIIVLEVGALNRGNSWKMGIGGINNDATWCEPYEADRASRVFGLEPKPWKDDGEFISIFGQRTDSYQWNHMPSMEEWMTDQIINVKKVSDRPIVIRPHPRDHINRYDFLTRFSDVYMDIPKKIAGSSSDASNHMELFERSHCIINESSGPSVQGVLAGIRVKAGKSSLAWDLSLKSFDEIEQPIDKDPTEWLNRIAHTEFFNYEISSGLPWINLKKKLSL